jgi:hypothetical protein
LNRLTDRLCGQKERKFRRSKITETGDDFTSCNPCMVPTEIQNIIIKMETGKFTKVEHHSSMKTNGKAINNAQHTANSPKIFCSTTAEHSNAIYFYDKGRGNKICQNQSVVISQI